MPGNSLSKGLEAYNKQQGLERRYKALWSRKREVTRRDDKRKRGTRSQRGNGQKAEELGLYAVVKH